jgi:hypothetical protein
LSCMIMHFAGGGPVTGSAGDHLSEWSQMRAAIARCVSTLCTPSIRPGEAWCHPKSGSMRDAISRSWSSTSRCTLPL